MPHLRLTFLAFVIQWFTFFTARKNILLVTQLKYS